MFTAAAVRRGVTRLALVLMVLMVMVVMVGGGVAARAAAGAAAAGGEMCDAAYVGQRTPGPEPERTPRLMLQQEPEPLVFGQDRRPRKTTIRFVTESSFFADPANPIAASVALSRDNVEYPHAVAAATSADRGVVEVVLCMDPHTARLPAGEYRGVVTLDDDRLPLMSVPFEASLQYQFGSNWARWLLFTIAMMAIGAAASFGAAYRAAIAKGEPPPPFVELFAQNPIVFAFGMAALVPTWWSSYWRDTSWPGDANAFLTLGFGAATAAAAAMTAVTVYRGTTATAPTEVSTEVSVEPARAPALPARFGRAAVVALAALGVVLSVVATRQPEGTSHPLSRAVPGARLVAVPNVFSVPAEQGLRRLSDAGFRVLAMQVCSNSLPTAGLVRQVLTPEDGKVVVDKAGVTAGNEKLLSGTLLEVKITNGRRCAA